MSTDRDMSEWDFQGPIDIVYIERQDGQKLKFETKQTGTEMKNITRENAGAIIQEKFWVNGYGDRISISSMDDDYIMNCIRKLAEWRFYLLSLKDVVDMVTFAQIITAKIESYDHSIKTLAQELADRKLTNRQTNGN